MRRFLLALCSWRWRRALAACERWDTTHRYVQTFRFPRRNVFDLEE